MADATSVVTKVTSLCPDGLTEVRAADSSSFLLSNAAFPGAGHHQVEVDLEEDVARERVELLSCNGQLGSEKEGARLVGLLAALPTDVDRLYSLLREVADGQLKLQESVDRLKPNGFNALLAPVAGVRQSTLQRGDGGNLESLCKPTAKAARLANCSSEVKSSAFQEGGKTASNVSQLKTVQRSSEINEMVIIPASMDKKTQLWHSFRRAEENMAAEEQWQQAQAEKGWLRSRWASANFDSKLADRFADSFMGVIICLNAIYIGLSMDMEDGTAVWTVLNFLFTFIYVVELMLKACSRGVVKLYMGRDGGYARFDTALVFVDVAQMAVGSVVGNSEAIEQAPSVAMFRVLRLVKLSRLLRLLRAEFFVDLVKMIHGIMGSSTTLCWALVLFFIVIYVVALMHREFYGRQKVANVYEHFHSVPRALFTTFRCGLGDCSAPNGTPIFEWVHAEYGWPSSVFYLLFSFCIAVGVFNVINAIFVESTMAKAEQLQREKKKERFANFELWSTNIFALVTRLIACAEMEVPDSLSESIDHVMEMQVPREAIDLLVEDEEAAECLRRLDIDQDDHPLLADIFDPDNGGTVTVMDLVDGIRKLRGDPRRSDIVTVDLMIRALQKQCDHIQSSVDDVGEALRSRGLL
eukprot:TRINITY_DN13271_c0_g5_i1.p1 TRINITY_DN13271_c0_g5~~TRINITY_DN13271_c0_g5_i1.p1  ORF type:complete len:638 (-),score=169.11 TRINITY_DN13271_c0_g5_i1:78-1991(-)